VDSQANAFIMLLPVLWLLSTIPIPLSREANEPWSNRVRMALIHSWTTRSEESEVDEEMPQSAPAPHAPLRRAVPLPSAEPQYCITAHGQYQKPCTSHVHVVVINGQSGYRELERAPRRCCYHRDYLPREVYTIPRVSTPLSPSPSTSACLTTAWHQLANIPFHDFTAS